MKKKQIQAMPTIHTLPENAIETRTLATRTALQAGSFVACERTSRAERDKCCAQDKFKVVNKNSENGKYWCMVRDAGTGDWD